MTIKIKQLFDNRLPPTVAFACNYMRHAISTFVYLFLNILTVAGQGKIEISIKPTQLFYIDIETHIGIKKSRSVTGLILAYRPSTKDSGKIKAGGSGMAGGYQLQNIFNRLYTGFTTGLFKKFYVDKKTTSFLETDLFYRNWKFNNKNASYNNVEGYRFNGHRTENVNVYCLKLLAGRTVLLSKSKKVKPFIDFYTGLGIRYKLSNYKTQPGYVYDIYYDYKTDAFKELLPSFQAGLTFGLQK